MDASDNRAKKPTSDSIASRTRAVEQIKRLLAVVMGLSVTTFAANAAIILKASGASYLLMILPIAAAAIIFLSLALPFYFSIERHLEFVYLDHRRTEPPWQVLTYEIVAMILTAMWFVLLSHSLSDIDLSGLEKNLDISLNYLAKHGGPSFVRALVILYIGDCLLLVVTLATSYGGQLHVPQGKQRNYIIWSIAMDILCFASCLGVMSANLIFTNSYYFYFGAVALTTVHCFRFFYDLKRNHETYFPAWNFDDAG